MNRPSVALFQEHVVRTCKSCGRRLPDRYEKDICAGCEEQELFNQVKEYIRTNDVKEWEVAEHFGIPIAKVKRWIKEGRIQYKEEEAVRSVIMNNYCQTCGKPTNFGTICPDCMREKRRKQKHGVAVTLKKEHNKMQFMEEDLDKK